MLMRFERADTGPQLLNEFVGQNFRGMMVALKAKFKYEMSDEELESYVSKEEDKVIGKLKQSLRPCDGVDAEFVTSLRPHTNTF